MIALPAILSLVFTLILLTGGLFCYWGLYDLLFGEEDFETSSEAVSIIAEEIRLEGKEKGVLYDLGSCRGSFALKLQKLLPDLKIIAIDHSRFRILLSRLRAFGRRRKPVFLHGDLFSLPMLDADVINIYLPREMLPEVRHKLSAIGKNIIVTMFRTSFTDLQPLKIIPLFKTEEMVRVYIF